MANQVTINAPASPAATWFKAIQTNAAMPHSYVISFDVERTTSERNWAVVLSKSGNEYYLMGVNASGYPFIWRYRNSAYETLFELPVVTPVAASVQIAFRERRFREEASEVWHTFSMWINGALVATHLESVFAVMADPINIGFAAYTGQTVEYSNISIPELSEFVDFITIDAGEPPLRALERAIEGQYVKYFIRWDGNLRAWLPKENSAAYTYPEDNTWDNDRTLDKRELKTVVRQLGAYAQAEFIRHDLVRKYGHRFTEVNNGYLMTEQECYRQAELTIKRMEEETDVEAFGTFYNPLLEIEDHVITFTGERIISQRSIDYNNTAKEKIVARKYTYGS